MREIKFRAFADGEMIYLPDNYCLPKEKTIYGRFELMQYTGLKDKNGKEIYEGDIIFSRTISEELWGTEKSNHKVEFKNGTFCLSKNIGYSRQWNDGSNEWYSIENMDTNEIEVIGNLYETPSLIN